MKLVYKNMGHVIKFEQGYVNELVIENQKLFFDFVQSISLQSEGSEGDCTLSISDKIVDFGKYTDITSQFAPFLVNRKGLLTKLYSSLEEKAHLPENYMKTCELLSMLEAHIHQLAEDFAFDVECPKNAIGPIIKAMGVQVDDSEKKPMENIFSYMELVRELDKDRLFIMINMRSYFRDNDMEKFIESVCLHGFRLLLLESHSYSKLKSTKRYTVDEDLCEF